MRTEQGRCWVGAEGCEPWLCPQVPFGKHNNRATEQDRNRQWLSVFSKRALKAIFHPSCYSLTCVILFLVLLSQHYLAPYYVAK